MADGGVSLHDAADRSHQLGPRFECAGREQFWPHHFCDALAAPFGDVLGHFDAARATFLGICDGAGVALHECANFICVLADKLPCYVSAHREADDYDRLGDI